MKGKRKGLADDFVYRPDNRLRVDGAAKVTTRGMRVEGGHDRDLRGGGY